MAAFQGATPTPRRSAENLIQATYQAALAPGIALQPILQDVVHPGSGIAHPRDPDGKRVRTATVFGLRAITRSGAGCGASLNPAAAGCPGRGSARRP